MKKKRDHRKTHYPFELLNYISHFRRFLTIERLKELLLNQYIELQNHRLTVFCV